MRVSSTSLIALLALVPTLADAAPRSDTRETEVERARNYALGYFLPKGRAAASFSQRLVRCPTADDPTILVESRAQIAAKTVPDYARLYRIDARAGFLAKRSTELTLYPAGTIKTINATVEGQGGAVIVSAVKLAAFAASTALGVPAPGIKSAPPRELLTQCRGEIAELIEARAEQAALLARFETRLSEDGLTEVEAAELAAQRTRLAGFDDALTLSSDPVLVDPAAVGPIAVPRLAYESWFATMVDDDVAKLPGSDGALLQWKVNAEARDALNAAAHVQPAAIATLDREPQAVLYYRRPVPVTIAVVPCTRHLVHGRDADRVPGTACLVDKSPGASPIAVNASASFPQLAGLFRLPIGRGGLFGSRSVAAEFDESGAPLKLSYGSDPGAAAIASTIDAARDAGTTLRDARKDALERRKALLTLRQDIQTLEDALDNPPAPAGQ